ncbi:MAG: 1-acyl-sn-glycerol-3-phosphate acyltransferase [Bacteroidetes bacterium]|nr:1-acyl-sn-glycerol-3-phosphate acyltransferase [Bacteroidota bacterium]
MKTISKVFRFLFSIYGFLVFILLMLIVFPFAIFASFWGKMKGGNFIYTISRYWADVWMFLIAVRHQNIFLSPVDNNKQYIFVANHISYMDIPSILKSIRHQRFRALGKAEMKSLPIFGFIYSKGAVMVDRSSPENRANSVRILKSLMQKGISIFIFPEGTFNETQDPLKIFYDGAFRIAIETEMPIKPILFLDSYDRLNYKSIFSLNPGKNRVVFLNEIGTVGLTQNDLPLLKQRVYDYMEEKLLEYKASWIKKTNQG